MKLCIVNDKAKLIHYNDCMMRTSYNEICAWYTVWKRDNRTISKDSTLRLLSNKLKAFKNFCGDLVLLDPKLEKVVSNFSDRAEDKFTQMHNEYINRK